MSKVITRLGLLGLCVTAALSLMAFGASGAQAAGCTPPNPNAKPCWMVNNINTTVDLTVVLQLTEDTLVKLISHAVGQEIQIDCKEFEAKNTLLLPEGKATGEIWFKNCTTYLEGVASAPCKPIEPIKSGGELEAVKVETTTDIKATNKSGTFATIEFDESECGALPGAIGVGGTLWLKDCVGSNAETEQLVHLIEERMKTPLTLFFGEEPAEIRGSIYIELFDNGVMRTFSRLS